VHRTPRALAWRSLAAALALATAVMVTGDLRALHAHAHDLGAARRVVIARRDLVLGTTIHRADVVVMTRYSTQVAPSAVRDVDEVVGRVVTLSVAAGDPVLTRSVEAAGAVPNGARIVRVPDPQALDPPPGSVVDVVATPRDDSSASADGFDLGDGVVVHGAVVVSGDDTGTATAAHDPTVALVVPVDDVTPLAAAIAGGTILLALARPSDACCPDPR